MSARYETKFVLNEVEFSKVLRWLHERGNFLKKYPERWVHGLYFDDDLFMSARDNLAGISDREKLRLRWYETSAGKYSKISLELKCKEGRLGSKKRVGLDVAGSEVMELPLTDIFRRIGYAGISNNPVGPIGRNMNPVLYVRYKRSYYESVEGVRLTIDDQIRFSHAHVGSAINKAMKILYPKRIMELKFDPPLKSVVSQMFNASQLVQKRHSKYLAGLAVTGQAVYL
jgi:hypothetical protein